MSTDKNTPSWNELIRVSKFVAPVVISLVTFWVHLSGKSDKIEQKIDLLIANREADARVIEERIENLKSGISENKAKTNELDKQIFRIMAILPKHIKSPNNED